MVRKPTFTTTHLRPRGALAGLVAGLAALATLTAACAPGGDGDRQTPPHDIVVNLGGELSVLKDLNARPLIVGPRPAGAENADAYRLTSPSQLDSGEVVGIRDGGVVAIEPSRPDRAVLLGQAGAWFPASDGERLWAVTEEPVETACPGQRLPRTVAARFTVSDHETSGRPSRTVLTLPCGVRPIADTSRGLLAVRTTGDTGGTASGVRAVTDVVLLNARADAVTETIAGGATVVAASPNAVIWRDDVCGKGNCTHTYDPEERESSRVPSCESGDTMGVGMLDPRGRWYVSRLHTNRLAILDLHEGTCRGLEEPPTPDSTDLEQTFSAAWSGQSLMLLDRRSGTLTSVNASSGKADKRTEPLAVVNEAQIWGTGTN